MGKPEFLIQVPNHSKVKLEMKFKFWTQGCQQNVMGGGRFLVLRGFPKCTQTPGRILYYKKI